ncbi:MULTISPECIES: TraB/VirB10 family protein [Pseudomonas]|uniref:Conjugal transfer protein TraB n=3 Tax=Pseudomonas TaxID=286 RepID=A0A3G1DH27_PSEAI|nr:MULTISPECIES: TraB/VirB10 family protein [Pseudomonas]AXQ51227.1 conjugal transfer protein TraB [Stenotrophomonas rhizophila]MCO6692578.1 TraB/VirB10 family protein [Pseudomonas shirazica]AMP35987.1 Conjugal transfer protein TraB [Pseudomonas aeruginosa]ESW38319.1 conjugal transfer protein TraB [Pseudomonas taiwanensis SJ9]MCZ9640625.1 TraB/VirB10 family protein [Pseudomonas putida]
MAINDQLKEKWNDLSPRMRTIVAIAGLFSFLMIVGTVIVGNDKPKANTKASTTSDTKLLLPRGDNNTPEQLMALMAAQNKRLDEFGRSIKQMDQDRRDDRLRALEEQQRMQKPDPVTQDTLRELKRVSDRLEKLEQGKTSAAPALNGALPGYESATGTAEAVQEAKPKVATLRITGGTQTTRSEAPKQAEKPTPAMPAGSFFEAVLLNGMDAPTSSTTQKNPVPTTMRIKSDAVLPNKYNVDVKECFALASGYGVLSSERAMLRTETFSCVRKDGKIIEGKMEGYIVGEDGRVGMRGRLVSKQGQMIAKTLVAGGLSGLAQGMTPQTIPQLSLSDSSTTQTQSADASTILQTGVAKGFSTSANEIAKFYMEMAREMTPVVEIDAGRKVTVMLVKGIELK